MVQKRAEARDYLDIDALILHGVDLAVALAAGRVVYGRSFNPMVTLKALSFFEDLPTLAAVEAVDPTELPEFTPYVERKEE